MALSVIGSSLCLLVCSLWYAYLVYSVIMQFFALKTHALQCLAIYGPYRPKCGLYRISVTENAVVCSVYMCVCVCWCKLMWGTCEEIQWLMLYSYTDVKWNVYRHLVELTMSSYSLLVLTISTVPTVLLLWVNFVVEVKLCQFLARVIRLHYCHQRFCLSVTLVSPAYMVKISVHFAPHNTLMFLVSCLCLWV